MLLDKGGVTGNKVNIYLKEMWICFENEGSLSKQTEEHICKGIEMRT